MQVQEGKYCGRRGKSKFNLKFGQAEHWLPINDLNNANMDAGRRWSASGPTRQPCHCHAEDSRHEERVALLMPNRRDRRIPRFIA
jgi:hypothetical protein